MAGRAAKAKVADAKAKEVALTILEKELEAAKAANVGVAEAQDKADAAKASLATATKAAQEAEAKETKALATMKTHMGTAMANAHTTAAHTISLVHAGLDGHGAALGATAGAAAAPTTNATTAAPAKVSTKPLSPPDSTDSSSKCPISVPGPNGQRIPGTQIFSLSGSEFAQDMDFEAATKACTSRGAKVCDHLSLIDAYRCGYNSCVAGWTSSPGASADRPNTKLVEQIVNGEANGCGTGGANLKPGLVVVEEAALNQHYGVHCCGASLSLQD
jgi:hypothetical protein